MFGLFRKPQLPAEDELEIVRCIRAAESKSRAEIRVHLSKPLKGKNIMDSALLVFRKMGMHKTELHNGVLIYVSLDDRQFAIIGDSAIHECVTEAFWQEVRNEMAEYFQQGAPTQAICHGIHRAGEKLQTYFPLGNANPNELSDEISRG